MTGPPRRSAWQGCSGPAAFGNSSVRTPCPALREQYLILNCTTTIRIAKADIWSSCAYRALGSNVSDPIESLLWPVP